MESISINKIEKEFKSHEFHNEDDVKLNAYSDIILPIQKTYAPDASFRSEHNLRGGSCRWYNFKSSN